MSTPRDPVAALRALAAELPPRSALAREFAYHARRLTFHEENVPDMWDRLEGYEQVSRYAWTPDERAAFALAREALAPAGVEGGAK